MHLEPVEDAYLDRLDQVTRLDPRLLARVTADERRTLEDDVVELARPRIVGAYCADERALLQPFAPQHGVPRCRDRDNHVAPGRVTVRLAGLGACLPAELGEARWRPAVGDDALDPRQGLTNAGDLATRLPAAAQHAEGGNVLAGEVLRRYAAGGARAELA